MEAVPGVVGLAPAKVVPLGLGTAGLESFTGYAARMSAKIAVPTPTFVRRALQDAEGGGDLPLRSTVTAAARRLNVGEADGRVATAVTGLTGQPGLERLSYFAFLDLFGVPERGVLAQHRRWCPACWKHDAERYERKVWWLALVEACSIHECLLQCRCPTCGRLQPILPRAVRIYVCSFCGHDLHASGPVSAQGPCAERMLWYAREGARLVHAGEAIALAGLDEREGLAQAYRRLADLAQERNLPAVERFFGDEVHRAVGSKIEALLSGLWRLRLSVLDLFSADVRVMVGES